jgi:hypothetical protein
MNFKIIEIEFDFSADNNANTISDNDKKELIEDTISKTWEADDEVDLQEKISDTTGWFVIKMLSCKV